MNCNSLPHTATHKYIAILHIVSLLHNCAYFGVSKSSHLCLESMQVCMIAIHYVCCGVLQCVAVCCSVLQCVAVYCSVLQCVAVCCSVLQCGALCCSVLQCVAVSKIVMNVCKIVLCVR